MATKQDGSRDKAKGRYNELLSIFNKELDQLADALSTIVPGWMKSELFVRALGPIGAWIEGKADVVQSPFLGAAIEKLSDFLEGFGHGLRGDSKEKPTDATPTKDWVEGFKKSAYDRLQKASADTINAEFEKIKKEFEFRIELVNFIKEKMASAEQAQTQAFPHKPLITVDDFKKFMMRIENTAKNIGKAIDDGADKLAPHVGDLANWLETKGGR